MKTNPGDSLAVAKKTITSVYNNFDEDSSLLKDFLEEEPFTLNPPFDKANVNVWFPEFNQNMDVGDIGPGDHMARMMAGQTAKNVAMYRFRMAGI